MGCCTWLTGHTYEGACLYRNEVKAPKKPDYLSYPEGIGDVRFHYFDGRTFILKRVQFDNIGSGSAECRGDLTGELEDGEIFHVPNVAWWEVVYLP